MRYSKIADEIAKEYERKLRFEERRKLKNENNNISKSFQHNSEELKHSHTTFQNI